MKSENEIGQDISEQTAPDCSICGHGVDRLITAAHAVPSMAQELNGHILAFLKIMLAVLCKHVSVKTRSLKELILAPTPRMVMTGMVALAP